MNRVVVLLVTGLLVAACGGNDAVAIVTTTTTTAPPTTPAPTTTTTTAPTTTTTTEPPPREPVVIAIAGDTSFTNGLDATDPFGGIGDLLAEPDLMIVNLETAVADADVGRPPVPKRFLFRSPPASVDLLVEAGVDVVTLANNHTLDYGVDALLQTLEELDARGVGRVGAAADPDRAWDPLIVEVGAWRIGIVSATRVPCDWAGGDPESRPHVAWACPPHQERVEAAIAEARAEADVVLVAVHGGAEGERCPSGFMSELRERWAELEVDLVVDGHPHVLQGLDRLGDTWIVRSTGNFAFPSARGVTADSAVFRFEIAEEGITPSVVPVRVPGGRLERPADDVAERILADVDRYSDNVSVGADGSVTADPGREGAC